MGRLVEFKSDGGTAAGYLAQAAEGGAGLGVVVVGDHGRVDGHIVDVCDRFAEEGFTALAPDLHHGRAVPDRRPEAAGDSMVLDRQRAAGDLSGAVDFLQPHPAVRGHGVAVVGFRTGAGLALWLAVLRPDAVRAAVPFYGVATPGAEPDWAAMSADVEGHYAEDDPDAGPEAVRAFAARLDDLGKEVRVFTYAGTAGPFFDDTRPEAYDDEAARQAWVRTLEFLRAKLG